MFEIKGEERFDQAPAVLWPALSNPQILCDCFPGVDQIVRHDDRSAALVVRPGFSFVRGTLQVSFEFVERDAETRARVLIHIRGIGSSAELEAEFRLMPGTPGTPGTVVQWHVRSLAIGGLLKAVSPGLIQAAAQKVAADTWSQIRDRVPGTA